MCITKEANVQKYTQKCVIFVLIYTSFVEHKILRIIYDIICKILLLYITEGEV